MNKIKAPRLVVAGLVKYKNKYLLVKELLKGDNKEYWIVPGGGVEFGETLEEAVQRELLEEVGIVATKTEFIGFKEAIFASHNYHTIIFFYLITPVNPEIKVGEDAILDAQFFSKTELPKLNLVDSAQWLLKDLKVIPAEAEI